MVTFAMDLENYLSFYQSTLSQLRQALDNETAYFYPTI
jgi:hypothetical protein